MHDDLQKFQQMTLVELVELLRHKDLADSVKKMIKSKLLKDHQVDLYWDHTWDVFKECPDAKKVSSHLS